MTIADTTSTLYAEQSESSHFLQNEHQTVEPPLKLSRKHPSTNVHGHPSFHQQRSPNHQWPDPFRLRGNNDWSHPAQQQPQALPFVVSNKPEKGNRQWVEQQRSDVPDSTMHGVSQSTSAKRGPGRPRTRSLHSHAAPSVYEATLEKNRVAARNYRRRDAEATMRLKTQAEASTSENKALKARIRMLREEVLSLKYALLQHTSCGFHAIDEYIQNSVKDMAGAGPSVQNKDARIDEKGSDQ